MTDTIHTCSYFCDRPNCIKAQRDELRDRIAMVVLADKQPEALTLELKRGAAARPHDVEARSLMNAAASAIAALEAENGELRAALESAIDYLEQAVTDYVLTYGENWRPARLAAIRKDRDMARAALKETP